MLGLNLLIPEIILLLNYLILIVYYGYYTISKTHKYLISYKQNTTMPALILLVVILLELQYPFASHYILENSIYINEYSNSIKLILNLIVFIICIISCTYIKTLKLNNFETYILILSAQIGVLILLISNNLILLYLSLELTTITIYILISLNKLNNYSIEAGLKYFIIGAVTSGMFLIGLSILYGTTGVTTINDLFLFSSSYYINLASDGFHLIEFYMILSFLFIIISLLFKIYSAPFHLWISDIYQGAPMHVLSYISTVPSLANIIILVKFLEIYNYIFEISYIILFFGVISIISGSIGALLQRKLKRLLAYSSITHVGYFLLVISIYLSSNVLGLFTFYFYYLLYLLNLMLLFSILLQNTDINNFNKVNQLDQITDYQGIFKQNSFYFLTLLVVLLSIAGIPPFVGFFGKLYIILSLIIQDYSYFLLIFFIIMAVISCYYYLNIIKNIYYSNILKYRYIQYSTLNNIVLTILSIFLISFIFVINHMSILIYNLTLYMIL